MRNGQEQVTESSSGGGGDLVGGRWSWSYALALALALASYTRPEKNNLDRREEMGWGRQQVYGVRVQHSRVEQ